MRARVLVVLGGLAAALAGCGSNPSEADAQAAVLHHLTRKGMGLVKPDDVAITSWEWTNCREHAAKGSVRCDIRAIAVLKAQPALTPLPVAGGWRFVRHDDSWMAEPE